ncbi:MAG: hypothetical protein M1834_003727 [Cirrosporium novae-zelandiae]|nr:MAG: hypothetical protein M1834_003727 [Cirrosporium novae-zelandiae]
MSATRSYADILRGKENLANGYNAIRPNDENTHPDGAPKTSKSIYEASSLVEVQVSLAQLHDHETTVTNRLDELLVSQRDLSRELGKLNLVRAQLGSQAVATRDISNGMLSEAASLASRISSAVKQLDLEQSRVRATLDVVEQVSELKTCVLGVTGSMGAPQDWETAASYLNRASKIPKDVINDSFAAEIVPTAEVPDPPATTLENAAESLCGLFLREFEKAAKENNGAKVTRFFKLFPLIGKSDIGLDVYGRYVCEGVASRARTNLNAGTGGTQRKEGFFYANALTKLFEQIAQIVDGHGALVERHYGAGKMVKVIQRLQLEADLQGGIIIDTWADERHVERRLTDIKSYAFSFLVQSFLPAQKGTPRAGSPANANERRVSEDEGVDMKEIDGLLNEMAVMLGRWSLYTRFIADKCKLPTDEKDPDSAAPLVIPDFVRTSNLNQKVSSRLIQSFNAMTTFFFRRSVEKAFQLDESPPDLTLSAFKPLTSNPPYITSAVDDVMYIIKKLLQQSLATSSRPIIASVVPTIARVLGSDFVGMIQRKMRDESYPKAQIQGALPPEHTIIAFLVLINNLDVATDYLNRIIESHLAASPPNSIQDLFPLPNDAPFITQTLTALGPQFSQKTTELISDGIHVTFNNVLKPRLRPLLADSFRDVDYAATTTEDTSPGGADPDTPPNPDLVRTRFQSGWDGLTLPLTRILTSANADRLIQHTSTYLGRVLEKRIWSYHGRVSELGAVRLERDVMGIVGVVVKGRKYGLRDVFARCSRILMVMNLEEEEWDEMKKGGDGENAEQVLSMEEMERARGMVRDRSERG